MTAPFLSPAQIRNRLVLVARMALRVHRPGPDGRCRVCRVPRCPAVAAARGLLAAVRPPHPGPRTTTVENGYLPQARRWARHLPAGDD
ncbi:hypothetical protein [Micromonospora okii]|uniref:hypothetical protein n=1 Tax=Micromonospora okii TaxID=1182970 RepID=UPI001E54334C|nr:hypothetical protein [Micromonospora okii]